jgi:hypothetical protein
MPRRNGREADCPRRGNLGPLAPAPMPADPLAALLAAVLDPAAA